MRKIFLVLTLFTTAAACNTVPINTTPTNTTSAPPVNPVSAQLHISNVTPNSGKAGQTITISGSGFNSKSVLTMNEYVFTGNYLSVDGQHIILKVPDQLTSGDGKEDVAVTPGQYNLQISQPDSKLSNIKLSNIIPFTVSPNGLKPQITKITPNSGKIGDKITISGLNFSTTAFTIKFDESFAGNQNFAKSPDGSTITFTIPEVLSAYCSGDHACPMIALPTENKIYQVSVVSNGQTSNSVSLTVLPTK